MKDIPFSAYPQPANLHAGDRIRRSLGEAVALANKRALRRGRRQQVKVRPASSLITSTTYMVQEIR